MIEKCKTKYIRCDEKAAFLKHYANEYYEMLSHQYLNVGKLDLT